MTQEQALAEAQRLFPDISAFIRVTRNRAIGYEYGCVNGFYIWDHSMQWNPVILGSSNLSWEQALDAAKSKRDGCYQTQDGPFEDEAISSSDMV